MRSGSLNVLTTLAAERLKRWTTSQFGKKYRQRHITATSSLRSSRVITYIRLSLPAAGPPVVGQRCLPWSVW